MKEELSALMDDELDQAAAARALDAVLSGLELRRAWCTYQLIGDTLRGAAALRPGSQSRFAERLAAEPVVLCPGSMLRPSTELPVAWAAAAAVAGIGVVVWAALGMQPERSIDLARIDPAPLTRSVAAMSSAGPTGEEYLLAHQGGSPSGALSGFSHYARTVAAIRGEGVAGR